MKVAWILLIVGVVIAVVGVGLLALFHEPSTPAIPAGAAAGGSAAPDAAATTSGHAAAASNEPKLDTPAELPGPAAESAGAPPPEANLALPEAEVNVLRQKLKQIALGFLNYESAKRSFPPGPSDAQQLSWRVHLLPFLEQGPLYKRFHLNEPWNSPHNLTLVDFMPDIYRTGQEEGPQTAFVVFQGERTLFQPDRPGARHASVRDGASNTLLAVHAGGGVRVPWTKPDDVEFVASTPLGKVGFVNGRLEGVLLNAQTISLPHDIPTETVAGLITPFGDELVDGPGLARRYSAMAQAAREAPAEEIPAVAADRLRDSAQAGMSRMKNIALGMLNSEAARKEFPPAVGYRRQNTPPELGVSWRVMVLPFIEHQNLFRRYNFNEPWDGKTNRALLGHMPADFRHESTVDDTATRVQVLVGVGTPFGPRPSNSGIDPRRGIEPRALVDGMSNTILTIESGRDRATPWMQPRDLDFDAADPVGSLGDLDAAGTYAAMFDGSVRMIERNIDPQVLGRLALYRDEYEASNPDKKLDWASAVPLTPPPSNQPATAARPDPRLSSPAESNPLVAAAAPADSTPDARIKTFPMTRPAFHYAYDELTGNLLAIEYENNQATLLSLDDGLKELTVVPCPARPTATLAKRLNDKSFFLVGGHLDKRVDVFDAKDARRVGSLNIQTPGLYEFAASARNDDPFVYYAARRGSDYYIGRIDLHKLVDEGELTAGGGVTLSNDGSIIYLRHSPNESGYFSAGRIVEGARKGGRDVDKLVCPATVEPIPSPPSGTSAVMVAGPGEAFFALGNMLTSGIPKEPLGQFEFPVFAFFPDDPWAVGLESRRLFIGSVNDKRAVAILNLPEGFATEELLQRWAADEVKAQFTRPNRVNPVFIDPQRGRIVMAAESQVATLAVDSLSLPDEPLVATTVKSYVQATAGKELAMPAKPFDSRVAVRLAAGPPEMKLIDGVLHWSPTSRDIGKATVLIESRHDPVRFEQRLEIAVVRPKVQLPMWAEAVALSPEGSTAVVWGREPGDADSRTEDKLNRHLALVDVATGDITASCEIAKGVWQARVDAGGVYVLTKPGLTNGQNNFAEVLMLNLTDLKLAASGGALALRDGFPNIFEAVAGKVLQAGQERFRLPKLERESSKLLARIDTASSNGYFEHSSVRHTNDGWQFSGAVWDEQLTRAKLLFHLPWFLGSHHSSMGDVYPVGWGRMDHGGTLYEAPQKELFSMSSMRGGQLRVSPTLPAALVLAVEESAENVPRTVIGVHELVTGARVQSLVLENRESNSSDHWELRADTSLATEGKTIAACSRGSLYLLSTDEIDPKALKPPFRFRMQQSKLTLDEGQSVDVEYELLDGQPPYEVKMMIDNFHTQTTTERVARFRLSGAKLRDNLLATIRNTSWPVLKDASADPRARVVDYIEAVTPDFTNIVGRAPRGVPILVNVVVEATDKSLKPAMLRHSYFVELPQARVARLLSNTRSDGVVQQAAPQSPFPPESGRAAAERKQSARRQAKLAELEAELSTAYSNDLRRDNPTTPIEDAALARQARKGVQSANALLTAALAENNANAVREVRNWSDKKGHSTVARLHSVFADQVVLVQQNGTEVTVPIEKLSTADQEYLAASQEGDAVTPAKFAVAQMQILAQAIDRHMRRTGGYPPAYICDERGKPLLSWRVAILPDLNAGDLFKLFHFDQPWNSPHNRKLGSSMPLVFQPARGAVRKYSTNILAFRDEGSLLADARSLGPGELRDPLASIIMLGEVRANRAVPWTQPTDIAAKDFDRLDSLLTRHGKHFVVATADARAKALAIETADEAWMAAIGRADGSLPQAPLLDPSAAPLDDAEGEVSLRELQGESTPTPQDDARDAANPKGAALPATKRAVTIALSDAKIGAAVARATGAPAGFHYKLVDSTGAFAINPRTGLITVERKDRINAQLYPTHIIKAVATNARGDEAPVTIVGVISEK